TCLIGNGVVVDPEVLLQEIDRLAEAGVSVQPGRLYLSEKAHLIMPYHKALDLAREAAKGKAKLGTTGRGIGPCYEDKVARIGIRSVDLTEPHTLEEKIRANLEEKNFFLTRYLGAQALEPEPIIENYLSMAKRLRPFITDVSLALEQATSQGKQILFEGAQGTHLDVDHGTYPFVTSSNPVAGTACSGAGIGPSQLGHILGIVKAYTTRVGAGPFVTELTDQVGEHLREQGVEFGSTTGRPRRCGWLDLVVVNDAKRLNGLHSIAITKLDVLTGLETIKICVAYEVEGRRIETRPASLNRMARCVPIYQEMPGWKEDIRGARKIDQLPSQARNYLRTIEEITGLPISIVSVGPAREETIMLGDPFSS
ncbi:MAG TPA: adenylosuccinate synthase, partial [Desulfobacterales bacterium]|nr:adenylosuccinate synthase [Desulfobacterales bacterium]